MKTERLHERARTRGVSRRLHRVVRTLLAGPLRLWFRVSITGAERIPAEGRAILTPNHKSVLDAFFLSLATRRPLRIMAKRELFRGPLGRLIVRLGAFPIRRGEADAEAMETARVLLEQDDVVMIFPEGTRVEDAGALGAPHHGAGRLAIETGSPILPVAITGTHHLWLGPVPKPRHVRLAILPPVAPAPGADPRALLDEDVWPAVADGYGTLAATPGAILATLTALGVGAGVVAHLRKPPEPPRILGVVPSRAARRRSRLRRLVS